MGILYIVATPIGNIQDISLRSARTLLTAHVIACEDTRRTGILLAEVAKLFNGYEERIKPRLLSYYDEVESQKMSQVVALLEQGQDVVLVSDAGTPTISDPGFKLIRECVQKGIQVASLPGPSSVITALTVSGLPTDKFFFLGYPPSKAGHRKEFWEKLPKISSEIKTTFILFEAPHRILGTLGEMKHVFGSSQYVVIARELTKTYEEVLRDTIENLEKHFTKTPPKGEFVLLLQLS